MFSAIVSRKFWRVTAVRATPAMAGSAFTDV